ncbi:thioredoxin family protein [Niallia taxi]|nr:thioredoxin family protein [Niallia taxi]MDE5055513.1 thioredoxin family protein [Niallia taxi]
MIVSQIQANDFTNNKIEAVEVKRLMEDENKTSFVLVGNRSCSSCKEYKPILEECIKQTGTTIYYLDTENNKNITFLNENNISVTPTLLIIKDDSIKRVEGSLSLEETKEILSGNKEI